MSTGDRSSVSGRRDRPFYGWYVVAVAALQGMFGNGTISSGFPIFFEPIRAQLNIGYAQMSLVFSLARAEGGMGSPVVGWLVDKFGSRPLLVFGGLTAGIGLILLSFANSYIQLVAIFVGVVSIGKTAGLGQTLMATVNQWFIRRKALAMSTLMTSFAGGGAIVVPLLSFGISHLGWRETLRAAGVAIFLMTIPVGLIIRSKPEDMGLRPDGDATPSDRPGSAERSRDAPGAVEFTVRQALRTRTYWFMLFGVVSRVSATNAIIIHIFPILALEGMTSQNASFYVSAMFFLAIPLRFVMGVAGGKFSPRLILFVGMNAGAVALLVLRVQDGIISVIVFVVAFAVVEGVSSANWIMLGDYFGRSRFASLMGFMSMFHNVGLFVSPIYAGRVRDNTGSYDEVFVTFIPLYIISAFLFLLATRPAPPVLDRVEKKKTAVAG